MKFSIRLLSTYIRLFLPLLAAMLLSAAVASADIRQDAESAVSSLRRNSAAQRFPDDMKSLDLVFEVAQRYSMVGEQEKADKYYLLTFQKTQIIESMLKMSEVPDPVPSMDSVGDAVPAEPDSGRIIGSKGTYTVVKADTIRLVAAKLGVTQQHLLKLNNLDAKAHLKIGQKLAYDNRKIIPDQVKDGIIINIPDRTLYYFRRGVLVTSLPVALGSATKNEKNVWQTPVGKFRITAKLKDPVWTVPPSIQTEMEEQG